MRDTDDDEPYEFGEKTSSTAASWAFAVMMIVVAIVVAACCVGSVYIVRTT